MVKKGGFNLEPVPNRTIKDVAESKIEEPREIVDVENNKKKDDKKPSFRELWKNYPKSVFCIVGNEFCERFCYYGMYAILTLYLVNVLKFPTTTASAVYHGFIVLCYFSPLFGSILADGFIGKYYTIMFVSLFYASGNIVLSVAASFDPESPTHPYLDILGLVMIAIGTGGIKPCVSSFGGDQFKIGQERSLEMFFSIFYFSINAGSFISTILTPILRVQPCLGQDTCYSLAFGVPAILMIIAVIFFAAGTPLYKRYPPKGNLLVLVFKVIWVGLKNKIKSKKSDPKHDYWLEYYLDTHDCANDPLCIELGTCQKKTFLKDIHSVLRVFVMFIPVPFFWALYDQQGDRWTLQGTTMNGKLGNITVLPDQMGAINTILIMTFIPLFQGIIYPLMSKCFKLTYLRKMAIGGFLGAFSYVVCGLLQLAINKTLPQIPDSGSAYLSVLNYGSCPINVSGVNTTSIIFQANSSNYGPKETVSDLNGNNPVYLWSVTGNCIAVNTTLTTNLTSEKYTYAIVTDTASGWSYADLQKSTQGEGQFKINVNYFANNLNVMINDTTVHFAWCTDDVEVTTDSKKCNTADRNVDYYTEFDGTVHSGSDFVELKPNSKSSQWYLYVKYTDGEYHNTHNVYHQEHQGGIYTMTLLDDPKEGGFAVQTFQIASDNSLSIFWQLPQYIVITAAEILFSITGLEFSFTQAPLSMKSVIMAAWLLTDSIGNIIIIFIDEVTVFSNIAYLFFLFAIIMFVIMIVFVLLAVFYYKYDEYIFKGDEDKKK